MQPSPTTSRSVADDAAEAAYGPDRFKWLKRYLIAIAIATLLLVPAYVTLDVISARRLRGVVQSIEASGEPLTAVDFSSSATNAPDDAGTHYARAAGLLPLRTRSRLQRSLSVPAAIFAAAPALDCLTCTFPVAYLSLADMWPPHKLRQFDLHHTIIGSARDALQIDELEQAMQLLRLSQHHADRIALGGRSSLTWRYANGARFQTIDLLEEIFDRWAAAEISMMESYPANAFAADLRILGSVLADEAPVHRDWRYAVWYTRGLLIESVQHPRRAGGRRWGPLADLRFRMEQLVARPLSRMTILEEIEYLESLLEQPSVMQLQSSSHRPAQTNLLILGAEAVTEHYDDLARRRLAVAGIACMLPMLTERPSPVNLDEVRTEWMPEIPRDPFSDDLEPLQFRREGDVIYVSALNAKQFRVPVLRTYKGR